LKIGVGALVTGSALCHHDFMSDARPADLPSEPSCELLRNEAAVITEVEPSVVDVLGWQPEQMIGAPSTNFVHPEDQGSAVGAWFAMLMEPGATATWRGRYRTAAGGWQWVDTENTNLLADADNPSVKTTMRRTQVDQAGVEEELRTRQQLLSKLADAVPVGLFQFDAAGRITFTNGQLHKMLGIEAAATCDAQFAVVAQDDRPLLRSAWDDVMADQPIDGLELRFRSPHDDHTTPEMRVCLMSLRPLTNRTGQVTGAIGCVSDVTESVQLRRELEIRAAIDGPTGCMNRRATMELLDLTMDGKDADRGGVGVIFVDIDRFKDVNDVFGHAAGDALLVEVARRIRSVIRKGDRLGRIGGDEFLVVCPGLTDPRDAVRVAERVSTVLKTDIEVMGHHMHLQASAGVTWSEGRQSSDELVAEADRAMYRSKRDGRGRVMVSA
jgi:diguanylate cyclase (GGDEF)-like protein/PAS domain S-box-containing protein